MLRHCPVEFNWCVFDVNCGKQFFSIFQIACHMSPNYLTFIHQVEREAVFIDLSLSDSTTFSLALERHCEAKWSILPQTEHLFPNAGQLFLAARCFPQQNLHLSTSLGLESLAFRSAFSRLLFADLSWLLLADTLPRFVWSFNEFTASPSSKFWSVFSTTRLLYKCWGIFVNQDLGS